MGTYLVCYSKQDTPTEDAPGLVHKKYEATTFLKVEDHAFDNCPIGYDVFTIEKVYHSGAEEMYGKTDFVLA